MTPAFVNRHVLPAAFALLPPRMDTPEARAMLLAIGLQESLFEHRQQIGGPARGYWQFELAGVRGVLAHRASAGVALSLCASMDYAPVTLPVYAAIADNDVLAAAFARLLLWTLPDAMPGRTGEAEGWRQYMECWRPGRPHRNSWNGYWETAWSLVGTAGE